MGCMIRQVRVLPESTTGTTLEGMPWFGGLNTTFPEFSLDRLDTSIRSWNSSDGRVLREAWISDTYTNAFKTGGVPVPPFHGSSLVGATYTGQSGQVFGGDFDAESVQTAILGEAEQSAWDHARDLGTPPPWPGWWNGGPGRGCAFYTSHGHY